MNKMMTTMGALLAAFALPASAVSLNPHGLGQVLLYPYYTVNKNQDTFFSVINTSNVGKVGKVRFQEGYNGRSVIEFFVFLSAHDVWTARVSQTSADGGAAIFSNDKSCTWPKIPSGGQPFSTAGFDGTGAYIGPNQGTLVPIPADGGPNTLARTREGHFEIVADGDIKPGSPTDQRITHVQTGAAGIGRPPGCDALTGHGFVPDLVTPTSGLGGSATIVNVGEGTFIAYSADALTGFTSAPFSGNLDAAPDDSLAQANSSNSTFAGGAVASVSLSSGAQLTLDYARGIDAVSAVFMADALYNEYLVAAGIGASTDWIVTFPTKRFYVDSFLAPLAPLAPFVESFHGQSNLVVHGDSYDQEELPAATDQDSCGTICPLKPPLTFPYEVNVLSFLQGANTGAPSGVLGSRLSTNLVLFGAAAASDAGWLKLNLDADREPHRLPAGVTTNGQSISLQGLPVAGFMTYNIINANAAPGRLANYGGAFAHRSTVSCKHEGSVSTGGDPCF